MSDPAPEWLALQQQVHELCRSLLEQQEKLNQRIDAHVRFASEAREQSIQTERSLRDLRRTVDALLLGQAGVPPRRGRKPASPNPVAAAASPRPRGRKRGQ